MQNKLRWKTVGILSAILAPLVFAQGDRGTITGVVRDSSGLPVPGAEVRIVNEATGIASNTVSSDSGNYTLPYLMPGTYSVAAEITGFKKFVRDKVQVRVSDSVELNIEMAGTDEMIGIALDVIPDQVTLVPELHGEITTTGGLDCTRNQQAITNAIKRLQSININVSLFIDPAEPQIRAALGLGARMIELNTAR